MRKRAIQALRDAGDQLAALHGDGTWGSADVEQHFSADVMEQALPWFDVWLPARFANAFLVPTLAVQQAKQLDWQASILFGRACMRNGEAKGASSPLVAGIGASFTF